MVWQKNDLGFCSKNNSMENASIFAPTMGLELEVSGAKDQFPTQTVGFSEKMYIFILKHSDSFSLIVDLERIVCFLRMLCTINYIFYNCYHLCLELEIWVVYI